jgi:trehalose 6-phosphate synthase
MGRCRRLIVVSNRGPVTYGSGPDGERIRTRGGGGLASALRGLIAQHEVTWIASAMTDEDRAAAAEANGGASDETLADGSPYRLRLVEHDPAAYARFYCVVANPMLWFVQHYLWDVAHEPDTGEVFQAAWHEGYVRVNRAFADAAAAELAQRPDSAVCFHDYHLYLAPRFLREARPRALISHFVHIPWVESGYWQVLPGPVRRSIHDGLLAADVVGFHTARWRRAFERSAADIVGARPAGEGLLAHEGRIVRVVDHAISADPAEFDALKDSGPVLEQERLLAAGRPELLILRVDRTDPAKNVIRGLEAFGLLLDRHPDLLGRVGLLALLDPSRQELPVYERCRIEIEQAARRVNERFSGAARPPVDLRVRDNFPETVAAYKQYDVMLVNALYDGLNLVAKEGPLVNERDGVLVLSENAGAHAELAPWALGVSPFDVSGQADALYAALTMPPAERRRRAAALAAHVRANDVARWIEAQLADLDTVRPSPAG